MISVEGTGAVVSYCLDQILVSAVNRVKQAYPFTSTLCSSGICNYDLSFCALLVDHPSMIVQTQIRGQKPNAPKPLQNDPTENTHL